MHVPPFDNQNKAIFDAENSSVPLTYFNIVKLKRGDAFEYQVPGYETCVAPATGSVNVDVGGELYESVGGRGVDVWDGEPEGAYVPSGAKTQLVCVSDTAEVFVGGARFDEARDPFVVRSDEIDSVQYGSDDTKTHRKIKHILGQKQVDRVGRLLVSELFTVGAGGWSGFPSHKHDTDQNGETRHNEIYNFRFKPDHGFGLQLLQAEGDPVGNGFHIVNGSTFAISSGYHPCVAAPGYEMYYFTILGGLSQRPLVQHFQPEHAYQVETIPGIKDMIAKFK